MIEEDDNKPATGTFAMPKLRSSQYVQSDLYAVTCYYRLVGCHLTLTFSCRSGFDMNLGSSEENNTRDSVNGYILVDVPAAASSQTAAPVKTAKYPGTSIMAGVIAHKSWAAIDENYNPTSYTTDAVNAGPSWADPAASVYGHWSSLSLYTHAYLS